MAPDHLTRAVAAERISRLRREADAGRVARAAAAGRPATSAGWALTFAALKFRPSRIWPALGDARQPQPCGC
jgi:hypothetical protein